MNKKKKTDLKLNLILFIIHHFLNYLELED